MCSVTRLRAVIAILLLPLLAGIGWLWFGSMRPGSDTLRVTFLDVGQGDACVIEGPGSRFSGGAKVVVVDGGGRPGTDEREGGDPGSRVVVPYLRSRGIRKVDWIVPTHPDDDHVQGLIAVAKRLPVSAALDGGTAGESPTYLRLRDRLRRRGIPVYRARRGGRIDLGDGARLEIVHPSEGTAGAALDTNSRSIVLRVVYGKSRLLLTGDAEQRAEEEILASGGDVGADLLKVGHHGSRGSTSDPFLHRVSPSIAVISCGRYNTYGHPHPALLDRLRRRSIRILRTDRQGAIVVETDGRIIRAVPTIADSLPADRGR